MSNFINREIEPSDREHSESDQEHEQPDQEITAVHFQHFEERTDREYHSERYNVLEPNKCDYES